MNNHIKYSFILDDQDSGLQKKHIEDTVVEFPTLVALKAANSVAGKTVNDIVASLITNGIKDGVEMHYNFFLFKVTVIKPE